MKRVLFFFLFAIIFQGYSQNAIGEKIKSGKAAYRQFRVLSESSQVPDEAVSKVVRDATLATLDADAVNDIANNAYENIEVTFPYNGSDLTVQLFRAEILADGFHVDTDKGQNLPVSPGVYYRGIIKGDFTSVAAMNFFNGEFNGVASSAELGNIVVGKLDKPGNTTDYIIYSDSKMNILNQFDCAVKEDADVHTESSEKSMLSTKCVTMYFEIDYDLYLANGSNVATTTAWMTSVFNNVQTLFANDNITTSLKSLYIWTTDDPYEGESSSDYLYQFNDLRPVFDGDVGQLVGIDPGGLGGVAVTINGLCSQTNFSYSDVSFSYSTVPTYSWTIQVITHEMGHLLGSRHTHACVWNGNNTAIDNCGPSSGVNEGAGCMTSPPTIPSTTVKGTIMSYCHLVAGVGISFSNGFGPQPKAAMLTAVNSGACLSTDCVNTCINTVTNITPVEVTNTTATVTWVELGSETTWQVAVMPFASNFPNWVTVNSPTYTATGLSPNTFYKVRIRPICPGLTATFRQVIFATTADWCSGVTIYDTGGLNNDYTDLQDYTRVLIPNLPNKKIKVTFTSFDLELDYDYLYVYDGASTSANDLSGGGFTGSNIPGPFVSSSPDGALTIRFFSDPGVVEAGYSAEVTCVDNLGVADFGNIDFTYYPNPARTEVNIVSATTIDEILVYNPQGRLLYQSNSATSQARVDISQFATGTYFFKLKFGDKQANFKILKN